MIQKYIWQGIKKNKIMNFLIALQTVVVFLVMISAVSIILFRFERYREISPFIEGRGCTFRLLSMNSKENVGNSVTSMKEMERLLTKAKIESCFRVGMYTDAEDAENQGDSGNAGIVLGTAYSEKLLNCHVPKMEEGVWLDGREGMQESEKEIPVVIAQPDSGNGKYELGDLIPLHYIEKSSEKSDLSLKVIGIVEDGASILGWHLTSNSYKDYRTLFWNYSGEYENKIYFFMAVDDLSFYDQFKASEDGRTAISWRVGELQFLQFDEGITAQEENENYAALSENGFYNNLHEAAKLREHSMSYIFSEMKTMIPILIALLALTLVSTISNTAIMLRQNLKNYVIFYMNGLTWKQCIIIHILEIVEMEAVVLALTMAGIILCRLSGVIESTVIAVGPLQLIACVLVIVVFVLFSMVVAVQQIGRKSAMEV